MPGLINCNEYFENNRLFEMAEDAPRMQFINAVRAYCQEENSNKQAKLVEAIVRTSRTVTDDHGLLPEEIQHGLMTLVEKFRDFCPTVVTVPTNYSDARKLIKTLFF